MAAFHGDVGTVPGMKLMKRLRTLDADELPDEASKAALDILLEWDGKLNADSVGAVVYSALNDEISLALMERNYGIDPDEFAANPDLNAIDHLRRQLKPAFINSINQGVIRAGIPRTPRVGRHIPCNLLDQCRQPPPKHIRRTKRRNLVRRAHHQASASPIRSVPRSRR